MLDNPELISGLVKQCIKFVKYNPSPEIIVDKDRKFIRFVFYKLKNGNIQWELDWDKWIQFKLPTRIEMSTMKKLIRLEGTTLSEGVIRSKKGIIEDLSIRFGDKLLTLYIDDNITFKNCTFDNYIEFKIRKGVNFDINENIYRLNGDNKIFNQLTGTYQDKNIGFSWSHPKPSEIFKNCEFKYTCNFPLYYHYKKEQVKNTNFFEINRIIKDNIEKYMLDFEVYSKYLHMEELK